MVVAQDGGLFAGSQEGERSRGLGLSVLVETWRRNIVYKERTTVLSCSTSSLGLDLGETGQRERVSRSHWIILGSWAVVRVDVAMMVDV